MLEEEHDVLWVIKHFRPLLDKINIDNIPEEPNYQVELLSDTRQYFQLGLEDCVLAICRRKFTSTANGFYAFSHAEHEGQQIFFLNIYINNNLFVSNTLALREKRRRTIIHEFTHCIAAFLSIGRIKTEKLIPGLVKNLASKVRINAMEHYQIMLNQVGNASSTVTYALGIYPDEHFRLGYYVDFEYSFSTVYKQLILDRMIFERYFTEDLRNNFYRELKQGNVGAALSILWTACTNLIANEAISAEFVNLRLREELLGYYFKKAFER
jgi:hypothetical protein